MTATKEWNPSDTEVANNIQAQVDAIRAVTLDDIGKKIHPDMPPISAIFITPTGRKLILYDCGPKRLSDQGQAVKAFMDGEPYGRLPL